MNDSYLAGLLDELVPAEPMERWDDVVQRARRSQRRYTVVLVTVAVLVLAPATWAAVRAFRGSPAPPPVRRFLRFTNRQWKGLPQAEVSKAHGVIQVRTKRGPLDLWVAPSTAGGLCFLIDYQADRTGRMQQGRSEMCWARGAHFPPIFTGTDAGESSPSTMIYGYVKGPAATVKVTLTNRMTPPSRTRTITLPVVEHFFLAPVRGLFARSIAGLDPHGKIIARWKLGS